MAPLPPQDADRIRTWNQQMRRPKISSTVHSLVKEKVLQRPDAQAIHSWDGNFTYSQLHNASGRLAKYLSSLQLPPESNIAVCMSKSKFAVVAMLATLRAGAVVVPLGIHDPVRRVEDIVLNTKASTVLVDLEQAQRLQGLRSRFIVVDEEMMNKLPADDRDFETGIEPDSAAWIVHTSGSTGTPKGVVLEHSGISTLAVAQAEELGADCHTRRLQFASFTFDVSIADIFTTLTSGGCVCIPSESDRLANLEQFINAASVNFASITSTVAGLLDPTKTPTLKLILLGGEAATRTTLRRWLKFATLRIGYGPAECTVSSSHGPLLRDETQGLHLGQPLTGCFWVADLDDHNELCPVGDEGELLIESPTVARCYFGDSVKTNKAFVTDPPFVSELGMSTGRRMYRTGDVVRQHVDGSISFVSRRDKQIKIRGQRVETGEIEHQILLSLPNLQGVSVMLVQRGEDGVQSSLVAALQLNDEQICSNHIEGVVPLEISSAASQTLKSLRGSLLNVLPPYMVPNIYVPVNHLPFNQSGKLDEKALSSVLHCMDPEKLNQYSILQTPIKSPRTTTEDIFRKLWSTLLILDETEIGLEDDFFRLGGDGDLASELASRASSHGFYLTTAAIFQYPNFSDMVCVASDPEFSLSTLEQYASLSVPVDPHVKAFSREHSSPASRGARSHVVDMLPVTDIQASIIAGNLLARRAGFGYFCFDGNGNHDFDAIKTSISRLVKQIECLRTAFVFSRDRLMQLVLESFDPSVQLYSSEESVEKITADLISNDMYRPPQLRRPMIDVALLRQVGSYKHRILIRLSQAMYDSTSVEMICKSLASIHDGDKVLKFPPFSRYVVDMYRHTSLELDHEFWVHILDGAVQTPIGKPRNGHDFTFQKTEKLESKIVKFAQGCLPGINTSTAVKAAWILTLSKLTESNDVIFGDILSTRSASHADLSHSIGCCDALLPLRAVIQQHWKIGDFLQHIQDLELEMATHATIGHARILSECTDWEEPRRFSSIVEYSDQVLRSISIGDTEYAVTEERFGNEACSCGVYVKATGRGDHITINIEHKKAMVPHQLAFDLLDTICTALKLFITTPDMILSDHLANLPDIARSSLEYTNGLSNGIADIPALVRNAYSELRQDRKPKLNGHTPSDDSAKNRVYSIGVDLIESAYLADKLQQQGHQVSIEDVVKILDNAGHSP